jgi:plastocyanin
MKLMRVAAAVLAVGVALTPASITAAPIVVKAKKVDGDWKWGPKTLHIVVPKRVKWKNPTNEPHTVRFYKGPMKGVRFLIATGESKTRKIKKSGTHKYRCDIPGHSKMVDGNCTGMCGKVVAH